MTVLSSKRLHTREYLSRVVLSSLQFRHLTKLDVDTVCDAFYDPAIYHGCSNRDCCDSMDHGHMWDIKDNFFIDADKAYELTRLKMMGVISEQLFDGYSFLLSLAETYGTKCFLCNDVDCGYRSGAPYLSPPQSHVISANLILGRDVCRNYPRVRTPVYTPPTMCGACDKAYIKSMSRSGFRWFEPYLTEDLHNAQNDFLLWALSSKGKSIKNRILANDDG